MSCKSPPQIAMLLVEPSSGCLLAIDVHGSKTLNLANADIQSSSLADLITGISVEQLRSIVNQNDNQQGSRFAGICTVDGAEIPVELRCTSLLGLEQDVLQISIHHTNEKQSEVLERDALTDLPDRRALARHYELGLGSATQHNSSVAILFMDLDQFKQVNDKHGHSIGDQVLCELAARWVTCLRDDDLVCRYGGDEFVVLLAGIRELEETEPIVNRLTEVTSRPVAVGDQQLNVGISIGVAISGQTPQKLDELIAAADQDMYSRKRAK